MQIKDVLVLGLAAIFLADCNEDQDGSNDCSSTTRVVTSTTTDAQGVVITNVQTTTDTGLTTSLVPVYTPVVSTTTDVGVDTDRNTISRTTDIGTSATETLFATTTDIGLQSGYAYTTNSNNETIATYTGTDTNQPSTQSITNTAGAAGAASTGNNDNNDNNDSNDSNDNADSSDSSSDSFAMATAIPYMGAAAMAGFAFAL